MDVLHVLMIGDVVGDGGLAVLEARLPQIIREHNADLTVVNGENAAEGFGLTEAVLRRILACGADVVTSGNHVWEKRDFWPALDTEERMLRPANYPDLHPLPSARQGAASDAGKSKTPGRGWILLKKAAPFLVINLQGREFMYAIDCPFRCFDSIFESANPDKPLIVVDFHAESTREKEALAYYLDGRASLVAGTHTHVQTADERILPGGTGYISDLGMTGVTDGVIGMAPSICIERAQKQILYRMEPAASSGADGLENTAVQGIIAEIDRNTGKTLAIRRF